MGVEKINQPTGLDLIKLYREKCGDATFLAFSTGKDSITAALTIREHLDVRPIYYFTVPGLEFVEDGLRYYEKNLFGGTKVIRVPHPTFYYNMPNGNFQPIENFDFCNVDWMHKAHFNTSFTQYAECLRKQLIEDYSLDKRTLVAVGVRAYDSPHRFMAIQKHGVLRPSGGAWYPVWNFSKGDIVDAIARSDVRLMTDYQEWGRSFDGVRHDYLMKIKARWPRDYRRILEWYPFADIECWKYERWVEGKSRPEGYPTRGNGRRSQWRSNGSNGKSKRA